MIFLRKKRLCTGNAGSTARLGVLLALGFMASSVMASETSVVPKAHAAWVYDVTNRPGEPRRYDPGYFATGLNSYNRNAEQGHKIRLIYTYAGSLEMYCPERNSDQCRLDDLVVVYPLNADKRLRGADGEATVRAYASKVDGTLAGGPVRVVPVIDGAISGDYEGSMKGFNELPRDMARAFADKVSRKVCSDPNVAGVQFDIEPFDVRKQNGQYHFYPVSYTHLTLPTNREV